MLARLALSTLAVATLAAAQIYSDSTWVPFDLSQFDGNTTLDEDGNVQLFWTIGDEYSTFGIASKSNGYLALGFSETGAMTGADMAVGYLDENGTFVFTNRHATGFVTPQVSPDQTDNMRFKEGSQADGVTGFVFDKKNTAECFQTQDDILTDAWQWFIYAFSDSNTFAQHQEGHMGKQYVKLGTGKTVSLNSAREVDNTKNFTVTQPELTIPSDTTTYCYTLHKMPEGKKNFLIGERPNDSSPLLHHLVLYGCYGLPDGYEEMVDKEPNCNWQNFSNPCNGFVTEWAPGMSARTFEPGYGKPFGEDLYEYAMLETHYNNPQNLVGEKDTASYTFLWTDEQVDTEIGTLTLGDLQVEGWFLEPGKPLVAHSTVCTPECTDKWPSEGVTAVSVFHHMHYRGRNARVQIIRDGKEINPLSSLRNFDYGYQFSKSLNEIQLLPGDKFITTCEYDTTNDTQPVPGGLPSQDEMCFAWVDYYPANNVLACTQFNLGEDATNPINGTAAICMRSDSEQPDMYKSDYLTSSFDALPATGTNCTDDSTSSSAGQSTLLQTCPEDNVCFSLNVPETTTNSGTGDIYFQLFAPATFSWVALAQGTTMTNANMFVVYSSADGTNVTLSPRTAPEHEMPTHDTAADVSLLEGSGISNGRMTANVVCRNCNSWAKGTMNLQSGSSDWVYAHLEGSPINSDDVNAPITQHDGTGRFQWDISRASGGSSANPFLASDSTTSTGSGATVGQSPSRLIQAHGSLAAISFVAIFPLGAILVRLANLPNLAWIHGGLQVFGYAMFIAAAGIGIFVANSDDYLREPHAVIGMLLLGVFFFMPIFGTIHHKVFQKVQKRTAVSYGHIFTGRVGVILGMINGGLGLKLAGAEKSYKIAYGVFAGAVGVVYLVAIVVGEMKRGKKVGENAAGSRAGRREKDVDGGDSSSNAS